MNKPYAVLAGLAVILAAAAAGYRIGTEHRPGVNTSQTVGDGLASPPRLLR